MNNDITAGYIIADVERWAERGALAGRSGPGSDLGAVLAATERGFALEGASDVGELISVSFLEHLPRPGEPGSELRRLIGPRSAAQLSAIG